MLKIIKNRLRQGAALIKRDRPALLTFLFHSIFQNQDEIELNHVDPQQHMTLELYREFIEYFQLAGYQFISPDEISAGLAPGGLYILATFDDGYFNNQLVLPLLQEYKTPAVFFIATNNVLNNECFWWDVLYRELRKQNLNRKEISLVQKKYKILDHEGIIKKLKSEYGERVLEPLSDIDRPFTPDELQGFATEEYVHIGNHTSHHYVLDNYTEAVQREQFIACQSDLDVLLGKVPDFVSYPNGNYNAETLILCAELGFKYGITVDKRKNYLPLTDNDRLVLGRNVLWGNQSIKMQCDIFRSDMSRQSRRYMT